jgi:hypothetical protein
MTSSGDKLTFRLAIGGVTVVILMPALGSRPDGIVVSITCPSDVYEDNREIAARLGDLFAAAAHKDGILRVGMMCDGPHVEWMPRDYKANDTVTWRLIDDDGKGLDMAKLRFTCATLETASQWRARAEKIR